MWLGSFAQELQLLLSLSRAWALREGLMAASTCLSCQGVPAGGTPLAQGPWEPRAHCGVLCEGV